MLELNSLKFHLTFIIKLYCRTTRHATDTFPPSYSLALARSSLFWRCVILIHIHWHIISTVSLTATHFHCCGGRCRFLAALDGVVEDEETGSSETRRNAEASQLTRRRRIFFSTALSGGGLFICFVVVLLHPNCLSFLLMLMMMVMVVIIRMLAMLLAFHNYY